MLQQKKTLKKKFPAVDKWEQTKAYMDQTFPLQRMEINSSSSVPGILIDWPYLKVSEIFMGHFEQLMDDGTLDKFEESTTGNNT